MTDDPYPLGTIPDDTAGGETPGAEPVDTATTVTLTARTGWPVDRRPDWRAQPPRSNPGGFTALEGTVLHFVGAGRGYVLPESADHERCRAQVRSVQAHALSLPEMSDIHYNAMVCVHGVVLEGRIVGVRSGANGTAASNRVHPAVCALLGVDDPPTDRMLAGIAWFHAEVERRAGRTLDMFRHGQIVATSCPGSPLGRWVDAGGYRTTPTPTPDPDPDPTPDPTPEDSTVLVIAHPAGSNARFLATSDGRGFIASMTWIPNEDAMARLTPHYPVVTIDADAPRNIGLIGPVPTGDALREWSAADFLNAW